MTRKTVGTGFCDRHSSVYCLIMADPSNAEQARVDHLVEELQLHQRELEMQNEILREAQHDLSASRDAFAALYDLAPHGVLLLDTEGVICQANQTAEQLFNQGDPVVGRHLFSFLAEDRRTTLIEQVIAARRGSWPGLTVEVEVAGGKRHALRLEGRVCPALPMPDGQRRTAILLVASDVTSQLEEQEALRRAKQDAEAVARAKSEFLSTMSHEIRTPLNGILGMNALLAEMGLPPQVNEMLAIVRTSGEDLLRVLNDVLDMSRIEARRLHIEQTLFDLRLLIEDVAGLYAPLTQATGVELVLVMDPALPRRALGDAGRLRQVLQNLLGNAVKFTSRGEVRLSVSACGPDRIRFAVTDTGIGMDEAVLARLFKPFTQADMGVTRKFGGTGLGLSIAFQLVQLMGGSLHAESRSGLGTTLSFDLAIGADAPPGPHLRLMDRRVAIVERHTPARLAVGAQLRAWGMTVYEAADLADLAAQLEAWRADGRPALAGLIDDETLIGDAEAGRLRTLPTPILLATSGANEQHAQLLASSGVAQVLMRPVKPSRLEECLIELCRGSTDLIPAITPARAGWRGRTVLVVEDHPVTRLVMRRQLEQLGLSVRLACDGDEGVRSVESCRPDLALVDLRMPVCDGTTMARRVRELERSQSLRRLPLVACSASTQDGERAAAIEVGMDGWVTKPLRALEIHDVLERHLGPPQDLP